jgi:hypothetical protein
MSAPTKRTNWVKVGDQCTVLGGTVVGRVTRIVHANRVPYVVVQWPSSTGRHTITTLERHDQDQSR